MHALKVRYYERKRAATHFSLERVFEAVRNALPANIAVERWNCRFESRRIVRRVLNVLEAPFHQSQLNHITGDVHYLALSLPKRRTIMTVHDCVSLRFRSGLKRLAVYWLWYWLPVRHVAAITAISEFTRDELIHLKKCDPEIVHVIPDPVPSEFVPWPKEFHAERPVILQVGTGEHNKNLCRVAEALRGIPCRLDIVGKLTERQKHTLESNGISYTNEWDLSDEQMVAKYRECDIVVFASTYEGFGMPIVEANATGRPVVTSNIPPMTEVAGEAGCLVNPFDYASIREGLVRVIKDAEYRDDLIAQGFENVKRFQSDVVAAQYAALYQEVLSRS